MLALILSVQLYAGGPIVAWRVKSCAALDRWLIEAHVWAKNSRVPFTGAAGCGTGDAPPKGYDFVTFPETPYKVFLVPHGLPRVEHPLPEDK